MKYTILTGHNSLEENRFKTKAEFIDVLSRGAEIELMWKGVHFGILPEGVGDEVCIYLWNQPETEQIFGMRRMRWSIRWLLTGWGT